MQRNLFRPRSNFFVSASSRVFLSRVFLSHSKNCKMTLSLLLRLASSHLLLLVLLLLLMLVIVLISWSPMLCGYFYHRCCAPHMDALVPLLDTAAAILLTLCTFAEVPPICHMERWLQLLIVLCGVWLLFSFSSQWRLMLVFLQLLASINQSINQSPINQSCVCDEFKLTYIL